MEHSVKQAIREHKLITIVRNVEREKLLPLAQAMYDGGIRLLEITYDASGRVSNEETAQYIKLLSEEFAEKMIIGAGTVLLMSRIIPDRLWSFLLSIARIKK